MEWDKEDNHNKAPSLRADAHLNALVKCINSCGVCFSVWEKKNADGKGSGTFDFTSLMASDKKLLLEHLPAKLEGVIKPKGSNTVTKLWKVVNNNLVCQENNYTKSWMTGRKSKPNLPKLLTKLTFASYVSFCSHLEIFTK